MYSIYQDDLPNPLKEFEASSDEEAEEYAQRQLDRAKWEYYPHGSIAHGDVLHDKVVTWHLYRDGELYTRLYKHLEVPIQDILPHPEAFTVTSKGLTTVETHNNYPNFTRTTNRMVLYYGKLFATKSYRVWPEKKRKQEDE